MYHSIGNCVFLFLEAVLTFEHEHIVRASDAIKHCLSVCNRHRKKNTITESIGKTFKRVCLFIIIIITNLQSQTSYTFTISLIFASFHILGVYFGLDFLFVIAQ